MLALRAHENVPRIDPGWRSGDAQTLGQFRGKVLERVNDQLDALTQKRLVELPGKDALAADLVKGLVEVLVAQGADNLA